jgi:hypothetical protein
MSLQEGVTGGDRVGVYLHGFVVPYEKKKELRILCQSLSVVVVWRCGDFHHKNMINGGGM